MKKSLVVLFTIFLIACNNGDALPEGIISEEKMALMLADVHVIESRVSKMGLLSFPLLHFAFERQYLQESYHPS